MRVNTVSWEVSPTKELLRLALPMVVSLLSVSVANLIDTLFVGRLGAVPLAAVGLGGVTTFTVVSFGLAVFSAAKVKVGEALGKGDATRLHGQLGAFLWLAVPLGLLSAAVAAGAAFFALPQIAGGDETGRLASEYVLIRALSFPTLLVVSGLANWLQAQGKPQAPMQASLIGIAVHVPLNFWFLFELHWGVAGLAWATVASQLAETFSLFILARVRTLGLRDASFADALRALRVGLPTGTERVLDMAAFAAVPLLLALRGPVELAAHQITLQLAQFSFLPLIALAEAAAILVSQAIGAARHALLFRLTRIALYCGAIYAALLSALFYRGRHILVAFFSDDISLQHSAAAALIFAALLQFINAAYNIIKGILRGLSVFRYVALVTVGVAWLVTPPFTYLVGVRWGYGAAGAWFVLCVEVSLGTFLLARRLQQELAPWTTAPSMAPSNERPTTKS